MCNVMWTTNVIVTYVAQHDRAWILLGPTTIRQHNVIGGPVTVALRRALKGPGELSTATILREITNIGYMKILSLKHEYLYSL